MLDKKTFYQTVEKLKNNYTDESNEQCLLEFKKTIGLDIKTYIENGMLAEAIYGEFDLFRVVAKVFREQLAENHFTLLWEQMLSQRKQIIKKGEMTPEQDKSYYKAISYLNTSKRRAKISNECVIKTGENEETSYISKQTLCKYLRTSPNKMPIDFVDESLTINVNNEIFYPTDLALKWVNEHFSLNTANKGLYKSFFEFQRFYTLQELAILCDRKKSNLIPSITTDEIRTIAKFSGRASIVLPYISYEVDSIEGKKNVLLLGFQTVVVLFAIFTLGIINPKNQYFPQEEIEKMVKSKMLEKNIEFGSYKNDASE